MIPYSLISNTKRYISKGNDWTEFQASIQNGQCKDIAHAAVNALNSFGIHAAKVACGFVKYPCIVISNDIHEAETDELRHWWVEICGDVYEFAKGTLVNGVIFPYGGCVLGDMESVTPPNGFSYITESYE